MRLFIAIPLPAGAAKLVRCAGEALEQAGARGRFTRQSNYHVTLRFIGESDALNDAAEALREAARDIRPFGMRLGGYGFFGRDGSHTGYVEVSCVNGELARLYESLESALWDRGFSRGRGRLVPHVTLGRDISSDENFAFLHEPYTFTADRVSLYESVFTDKGVEYRALHTERLV